MRIKDIFDPWKLIQEVQDGMVRIQYHPVFPLSIATYTTDCVIADRWNEVTTQCRGLIWDRNTLEIIARPFPKFHNLGRPLARMDFEAQVEVTDKMDGSLGIGYVWEGKLYVATKGSFTSPQAEQANLILREYYPDWLPPEGVTPLWEIIYPENRIVLDYGNLRYLALIEGIDITTGKTYIPEDPDKGIWATWPGGAVGFTVYNTLSEVVTALPRPNAEGFVVRYTDTDERIKIKQKDYLEKHKLVFNLSDKTVWKSLHDGKFVEYKAGMPDEFHQWMDDSASVFLQKFQDRIELLNESRFIPEVDVLFDNRSREARKELACLIVNMPLWMQACMWGLWDGKEIDHIIYKQFEPKGQTKVAKP